MARPLDLLVICRPTFSPQQLVDFAVSVSPVLLVGRPNQCRLIGIRGFAGDPGNKRNNKRNNKQASQQHADAVMNYLVSRGGAPDRMWSKGCSRDRLIRDCPEAGCKSRNRRVISILRKEFYHPGTPSSSS